MVDFNHIKNAVGNSYLLDSNKRNIRVSVVSQSPQYEVENTENGETKEFNTVDEVEEYYEKTFM